MLYHIMSKTADGRFFLTPKPGIRPLCAGVVGKAQERYPMVRLYAYAFMSNHIHLMLAGASVDIADFMAYVKREISRRIGIKYSVKGPKWQSRYTSTALPTAQSREQCLKYILAQGVKENLVAHPLDWPGLHCAKALSTGKQDQGQWLDSTAYKRKKREQARRPTPKKVRKANYYEKVSIKLSPLPHWEELPKKETQKRINELIDSMTQEACEKRRETQTRVLGVKKVIQASICQRVSPPNPPWWKERRRQITAWAKSRANETLAYLNLYYEFQEAFRLASHRFNNDLKAEFPRGAWIPIRYFPALSAEA